MRRKHVGQCIVSVTVLVAVMFVMTSSPTQAFMGFGAPVSEEPLLPVVDDTLPTEDPTTSETTEVTPPPTTDTSTPTYLDFDPAKNPVGLTSIKRLRYLQSGNDPLSITINLVNAALGFLGIISTVLLAYAGVLWFTARGNDEQVEKAKELIKGSLIGLVLTLMALSISILVFNLVTDVTTSEQSIGETSSPN